jgi:hypothetical protein
MPKSRRRASKRTSASDETLGAVLNSLDVLPSIFKHLGFKSLVSSSAVCLFWAMVEERNEEPLWSALVELDWGTGAEGGFLATKSSKSCYRILQRLGRAQHPITPLSRRLQGYECAIDIRRGDPPNQLICHGEARRLGASANGNVYQTEKVIFGADLGQPAGEFIRMDADGRVLGLASKLLIATYVTRLSDGKSTMLVEFEVDNLLFEMESYGNTDVVSFKFAATTVELNENDFRPEQLLPLEQNIGATIKGTKFGQELLGWAPTGTLIVKRHSEDGSWEFDRLRVELKSCTYSPARAGEHQCFPTSPNPQWITDEKLAIMLEGKALDWA